jgi:hypothetical protein
MDAITRLANESWEAMFRAQATLAREFEFDIDWGGLLPREYGVLHALASAADDLRITGLIDDALLTQAGVSRLVARLEKRVTTAMTWALSPAQMETLRDLGRALIAGSPAVASQPEETRRNIA